MKKGEGTMQRNQTITFFCILLTILFVLSSSLTGCTKQTNKDAPEITVDYLYSDYKDQLTADGAEHVLGSIELSKNEADEIKMILHPKDLIANEKEENGFHIVNYAINREFVLPSHAYCTFLSGKENKDPKMLSSEDFFTAMEEDYKEYGDFTEYGDSKLYDVYILDNEALLLLAHIFI